MDESRLQNPGELPDDLKQKQEELEALFANIDRNYEISEQEVRDFARVLEGKSFEENVRILTIMRGIDALERTLETLKDNQQRKLCMQNINRFFVFLGLTEK